ncbi:prolyl oligopeptidase family serine peptidase [Chitinophaga sp. OAE865]|uniref:alpha/beta hydrolase family protein n=1 Tax=Chitinophaga sp. OAE865 TaxID=2817898 RepID=UPI001AE28933
MKYLPVVLLIGILTLSLACKKEDALKGIDKTALFAAPTTTEINAVQQLWSARNLTPLNITTEETHVINAKLSLHIISFELSGAKEYAAVLVPVTDHPLPVMFYVGGYGTEQEPVNSIKIGLTDDQLPVIYVVPSLRGQYVSVEINNVVYKSPLSQGSRFDAFDGATDDVIATLTAVGNVFPLADTGRAMIRGGSRGGTVALLAGERDGRFKRVAPVAFNVDFIGLTAQLYNDRTYKEQFLTGLVNGTMTIAETRQLMIASSPLYFCSRLPKTQLHCGEKDRITPASQGELLFNRMKDLGLEDKVKLFIYPDRTHDDITTNNTELQTRINQFFGELW